MSDASDEGESDDENENVEPPPLPPLPLLPRPSWTKTVVDERNTWGLCSMNVRGVGSETSDTTGSSFYDDRANHMRRKRQSMIRESRWIAFFMLSHSRLGEQSLWKLSEEMTRIILEKTLKRQK